MPARTFNQGRLVAAGLALAAALAAVLVISTLSDSRAGSTQAPSATRQQTSTQRSVIVQSGRSVNGGSVTVQGAPGESVTAPAQPGGAATGNAKGGAGGSASADGGSATSGSVEIQTVGP